MYMSGKPRDPNDPTNAIWDDKYICFVHAMSIHSDRHVEEYGLRSSGVGFVDEEIFGGNEMVGLSVNDMIEKQRAGYGFELRIPSQGVQIYHVINDYLNCFSKVLSNQSLNYTRMPDDDIKDLDSLADFLYTERNKDIRATRDTGNLFDIVNLRGPKHLHPLYTAYLEETVSKRKKGLPKKRVSFRDHFYGDYS